MTRTASPNAPRRERRYHQLLETIESNTGTTPHQSPGIERFRVHLHMVAHGQYDVQEVDKSITAALSNGDVVAWRDAEGVERLTRATDADLKAVVAAHNLAGDPTTAVLESDVLPALREGSR